MTNKQLQNQMSQHISSYEYVRNCVDEPRNFLMDELIIKSFKEMKNYIRKVFAGGR